MISGYGKIYREERSEREVKEKLSASKTNEALQVKVRL
jgi:hypothetical protein